MKRFLVLGMAALSVVTPVKAADPEALAQGVANVYVTLEMCPDVELLDKEAEAALKQSDQLVMAALGAQFMKQAVAKATIKAISDVDAFCLGSVLQYNKILVFKDGGTNAPSN